MRGGIAFYPLGDVPHRDEVDNLGAKGSIFGLYKRKRDGLNVDIMAREVYEKRAPLAGEWYLSGAVPAAYRAMNNLDTEYWIVRLIMVVTEIVKREVR